MTRLKAYVDNPVDRVVDPSLPYVALEHIEPGTGVLRAGVELEGKVADDSVGHLPGDVRFGKLRPYLAKSFHTTEPGVGSGELIVLRPGPEIDSRFLWYLTLSREFIDWAEASSYGVKMPRTSWEALGQFDVQLPSMKKQRRIVEYLDTETARIDGLITEQRQVLALIEERRWAGVVDRIAHSGPEVALRRGLTWLTDGPFGSAYSSADYVEDGPAVIRLGNIGFAEWRGTEIARVPVELFERFRRYEVLPGDVLIASLGDDRNHAGRACVAPEELGPAMVKGKCLCARTHMDLLTPAFVALFLSSPLGADALSLEARGSTRKMVNLEIIKAVRIPLPPVSQQLIIVSAVEAEWAVLRRLSHEIERQLLLLREHRQALITAAVTGGLGALGRVA